MAHGKVAHDDVREAGIGRGFSGAEKETAEKERGESARETGEESGRGPDGETDGENVAGVEAVGEPAGKKKEGSIGPEKGGKKKSKARGRDGEFMLQSGSSDREGAAVNVGDKDREKEERENDAESRRKFFGLRRVEGIHGSGIVYQERRESN